MKKIIMVLLILSVCRVASAERWVCFDATTKRIKRTAIGDGLRLGICGKNNSNIIPTCIEANLQEYTDAQLPYKKIDVSVVSGNRITDLTQVEIDAILQAESDAQEASIISAIEKFNVTNLELMTALIQRINVRIPSNPITKQEIIQQLKDNR